MHHFVTHYVHSRRIMQWETQPPEFKPKYHIFLSANGATMGHYLSVSKQIMALNNYKWGVCITL